MPSELKVEDIESALIAAVKIIVPTVEVHGISGQDIDEQGNITTPLPAVLALYEMSADALKGMLAINYDSAHSFLLICGASNLRSDAEQRGEALALMSQVRAGLAGLRLALADGTTTQPIALSGAERFQWTKDASWYAAHVVIGGISQFAAKP